MQKLRLGEEKRADDIQQQMIHHWSEQNHNSIVAGKSENPIVTIIARTVNVLLDKA